MLIDHFNTIDNSKILKIIRNKFLIPKIKINKFVRPKLRLISITEELEDICVFHIHGGGFFSNSSYSFLPFTIKLADISKIPIYSIDYTHTPG